VYDPVMDDLRPNGTVEVCCVECGWSFWVDCLDSRLPDGPFVCPICDGTEEYIPKALDGEP
jgi:hypothetical protein